MSENSECLCSSAKDIDVWTSIVWFALDHLADDDGETLLVDCAGRERRYSLPNDERREHLETMASFYNAAKQVCVAARNGDATLAAEQAFIAGQLLGQFKEFADTKMKLRATNASNSSKQPPQEFLDALGSALRKRGSASETAVTKRAKAVYERDNNCKLAGVRTLLKYYREQSN